MKKTTVLITILGAALAFSGGAIAKSKGKAKIKDKHQSESRLENSNQQSQEYSRRGQERAAQRHDAPDQQDNGRPRAPLENPVDTVIDRNADNLKSGVQDLNRRAVDSINEGARDLTPPQPRRR